MLWRDIVGADGVLEGAATRPWAVGGVTPTVMVFPRNVDEVARLIARAQSVGAAVEPAGGGTFLNHGRAPPRTGVVVVVSLQRMNRVIEYEPADLVMSVEAGVTHDETRKVTHARRQHLPLDAPARPAATVGATVALSAAGPLRYGYRTTPDQVLGIQMVTGDGRIVNIGGKVVKNVAGYDLTRLAIGSHGGLGIITEVHVRLRPTPALDVTFMVRGPVEELVALALELRNAAFEPVALEVLTPAAQLLVRVHGNHDMVAAAAAEIGRLSQGLEAQQLDAPAAAAAWASLNDIGVDAALCVRLAALPTEGMLVLAAAQELAALCDRATVALHAGNGIARVYAATVRNPRDFASAVHNARAQLHPHRGSAILSSAPAHVQREIDVYPQIGPELRLMQELKNKFDPSGILAPGRFSV